jgi:predicted transglutaminase-like cysteine proteinase
MFLSVKWLGCALALMGCTQAFAGNYQELSDVYQTALAEHTYISDRDQYGVDEKWVPSLTGDCEDFALYLQAELRRHQLQGDLWLVKTETGQLHVVVRVGQWVMDNRFRTLKWVKALPYHWLTPVKFYNSTS